MKVDLTLPEIESLLGRDDHKDGPRNLASAERKLEAALMVGQEQEREARRVLDEILNDSEIAPLDSRQRMADWLNRTITPPLERPVE
jgi:hypothetical protein